MRVNVEALSSVERKVEVTIPADEVKEKLEKVLKEFQSSARVKGFRPGKVPRSIIEAMYKQDILNEVASRLVSESFEGALREASVTPISRPKITTEKVERDREFRYTAVFEIIPEFEVKDYIGIELKKERYEVKDEDIERVINQLREQSAEAKPLEEEREVRKGDYVIVDYKGVLDGKPIPELTKEGVQLLVGEGRLIPEFEENILGMRKGEEKEFEVTYPEDFHIKEVAGKTVRFRLKVKDVFQRILPQLDDEFAKDLGQENVEALRKKIKEDLEKRLEEEAKSKLKEELITALLERTSFDVPPTLVESEIAHLKREFVLSFQRHGLEVPPLNEDMENSFRQRALRNVKASLILGAIAKKEGIKVEEKELNNRLMEIARAYEVPFERVRELYEKNNMIPALEERILEEKVLDFLLEKAKIEEVSPKQT
ncbi:Trigger factor [bacterium HR37]|nr:Trigger factor [bacterium HR37]